ncbi:MAG: hypothetical protein H0U52_06790 [Chloroflexi bacterium]|nr:hypothetical protein [Chloroflexota bacterium]
MTINSTIPASIRRPGAYHEFKFLASGQQLVALPQRVVIVAEMSLTGAATPELPVQVFDEDDADTKGGKGSLAALLCKTALAQAKIGGVGSPEIWMCPSIAPVGGAAAAQTLTVTVATAEAGTIVLRIAGRVVNVGVSAGDAQNTIATAIKNKLDEMKATLPVTGAVAANVVTATNVTKGVNGNDVVFELLSKPNGVTVALAASVVGAGTAPIANPIAALYDRRYHAIALANHTVGDAAAILAERVSAWSFTQKNYRFFFIGERGSLGTAQTLQASYNDFGVLIINCEGSPSMPGELAVCAAVAEFSREKPNANLDNERLALVPPSGALAFTNAEVESALSGGVTPLTPDGVYVKIERLVTTQITFNSAPFEPLRDIAYPRTAAYMAEQIDIGYLTGFRQEVLDDDPEGDIRARVRDMVIEKHRAAQKASIIRDVDSFLDQIQVEIASSPAGRLIVSDPFRVAGPLHQGAFVHSMYL